MTKFISWHLDFIGFGASLLCALHCTLMPLVLTLGAFAGAHWLMDPLVEWIFIGASMTVAGWSLFRAYFKEHRNGFPLLMAAMGFLGLILAQKVFVSYAHWLMATGGVLIAYAHFYNWRLLHFCPKNRKIALRSWLISSRLIPIFLLLFYFLSMRSAWIQSRTSPSRGALLQMVWQAAQ